MTEDASPARPEVRTPSAPPLENSQLPKALRDALEERYILLTRNKLLAFLGGATAFLVVMGFVSWEVTLAALKSGQGKLSLEVVQREARAAEEAGKRIRQLKEAAEADAAFHARLIDARIARADRIRALKDQRSSLERLMRQRDAGPFFNYGALKKQLAEVEKQLAELETEQ